MKVCTLALLALTALPALAQTPAARTSSEWRSGWCRAPAARVEMHVIDVSDWENLRAVAWYTPEDGGAHTSTLRT
ncbi:MAG: hypothetical protein WD737_07765 [Gemmatimonadota bacterium]